MERSAKAALVPLVLLWLLVHAALLALILGAKFLFTKTMLMVLLVIGSLAFLFCDSRLSRAGYLIARNNGRPGG